ncbi:threonine--tRNA ligase, mitochondrial 1 [Nicotiana sylvestris]|uniref:threonine--tRNA ligase n=1 Tax=Nicotiana sylvestris TaxID=4096 RepID=A0A1U7Y6Y6_NICSY|nr:PREDICTED: threonine--tRNA ligase, mitochondrial [Nicotiana sylvestris]
MLLASPLYWRLFTQSICRRPPPCKQFLLLRRFSSEPPMGKAAKGSEANSSAVSYPKDESYLQNVIPKRIALFQSIQNEQHLQRLSLSPDPIKIELPSGTMKEGKKWNTTPLDIAKEISKSLASNALIAKVNGVLWDLLRPLEGDCKLELFTFDSDEGRDTFWHSSAHILGESLERTYGCKLCIGPCTTRGEGFYYDAFYGELGLNEDHFKRIESEAAKAVSEKQPFERIEVSRQQALDMFSDNRFKVEIIKDLPEDKTITVYRCGPLVDLCRGPHIPNTSFVKALACTKASSAYWRGDKDRESLQRVYGISYPDKKQLKEYLAMIEEAKKYDHRELTKKQELFFFHPLSPGSCFFLPHGARVCNKLLEFIKSQYWKRGYEEVWSPNMYNMQLWETSGHAANYKENMFVFEIEKQEFGLKPMNCPGHCLIFDHRVRSYRELPLRLADFGVLHRNEASGALTGLTRVRRFQQDDAHIFCRESQIKDEVKGVLDFISYVYTIFGFTFDLKLSTRPEKYLGDLESWNKAEDALAEALDEFGKPWEKNEGDGAFYGPKIDISVSDAMRRKFQCATLQLDFQLPQRFNLAYSAEDENKRERPVMIHRAILGSVERMFAILLEHFKGKWPFWLSPRQAMVCPVSDKSQSYALELRERIHDAGYYVDVDTSDRTIQKKVREAQVAQYNYILVVGEAEASSRQVSVRVRDKPDHQVMTVGDLLAHFKDMVASFQ